MSSRLPYLDNPKILLVVGVIAVHSAVTYGFDGTWYLESYDEMASGLVDALAVVIARQAKLAGVVPEANLATSRPRVGCCPLAAWELAPRPEEAA
jgi:hypothetical protein